MRDDTTITFTDPAFADTLSDLVRDGAPRIIKQAVQTEMDAFLQAHPDQVSWTLRFGQCDKWRAASP